MKKIRQLRLALSVWIPVVCFLGILILGIPFIISKRSLHTTQYIYGLYALFFALFLGIIVPVTARFWNFLKITKVSPFDGLATILLLFVSGIPLLILSVLTFACLRSKKLFPYRYRIYNFSVSVTIMLLGVRLRYHGHRDRKARFIIANHTSPLDYFIISHAMGISPWNIVAGINLRHNKPTWGDKLIAATIGKIVEQYAISIDRTSDASKQKSARGIISEIENGKNVAIFPEGTRTPKAKIKKRGILLQRFEDGVFRIAWDRKLCIQPLVLDFPVIWRGKGDDWWGVHPTRVDCYFLEIVDPNNFQTFEEFKQTCWTMMHEQLKNSKKVKRFLKY